LWVTGSAMKKKLIPILLFILAFTGFLTSQILWDNFHSNAELVAEDKQKYSVYETNFQALNLTTSKKTTIELKKDATPIIVLNFWASWCIPCLKEFPSLVQFQDKYKGQVKVIGINGDTENPEELIRKTEAKYQLNFESVADPHERVAEMFMIRTYPVSIIFHQGEVIYVNKKMHNFMDSKFLDLIDNALKAK
jgi:thiol-disulfide isomerase/thioredoxin